MLRQVSAQKILARFLGTALPSQLELVAHTNPNDPPDISALGFGFEVTQFPPDQSARQAVKRKQIGRSVTPVPSFQHTKGGDYDEIRREIEDPNSVTNDPYNEDTLSDAIDALGAKFSF